MNPKVLEQVRYDLTSEVLALGKDAPIDLETVIDAEANRIESFATEAAAILAFDGETASEYAFRVQEWLRGLIEKRITDEDCKAYLERCADDAEVDRRIDELKEAA